MFMLAAHRRKRRCSDGACSECYISEIWSEECEKGRESGEQRAETEEWKPLPPSLPPLASATCVSCCCRSSALFQRKFLQKWTQKKLKIYGCFDTRTVEKDQSSFSHVWKNSSDH